MAKNKGGRPSKYNEETCSKARYYLENYEEYGDVIPSHVGLAVALEVGKRTIYDWNDQEDKAEFSHILDEILAKQEKILVSNGLKGDFNAAITKLVLGKHGYHDKVEQDVTSGGKEIKNNFIIQPVTTRVDSND
jgi:hypothetical protein